ncbi:MAG: bifunctional adenosylcobinamide kinase/adenosylcobinamide-phosphate guanylyltransferase [Syntrophobacteraceae bacterium]
MISIQELMSPVLVLGGAKSGKSTHAEALIERFEPPFIYLATAQVLDEEMKRRVEQHQSRRKDRWQTVECPLSLPDTLRSFSGKNHPVLIDCITLWLSNLLCFSPTGPAGALEDLRGAVAAADHPLVIVSNEVGGGIVPDNALAREFRDLAGAANQMLARTCATVILITAGLPLKLK